MRADSPGTPCCGPGGPASGKGASKPSRTAASGLGVTAVSGKGASAGAIYQAQVIAFAYVHVIAQRPLPWFGPAGQAPTAVWGETRGPGDDVRLEFGTSPAAEVQARHEMNAASDLVGLVAAIRTRSAGTGPMPVALLIDRKSSGRLQVNVAGDLDRLRGGRDDGLGNEVANLLADPDNHSVLERLFVVPADFDHPYSHERVRAIDYLRGRLVDHVQAEAALDVLVSDAGDVSAKEGRRDAAYLTALLEGRGFPVKPPASDEPWSNRLDWIKESLLDARHDLGALDALERLDQQLETVDVGSVIRARSARLRAVALLRLDRARESLSFAQEAVRIDPASADALTTAAHAALGAGEVAMAADYAERAVVVDPGSSKAWSAKVYVAHRTGTALPDPPPLIAASVDYRTTLAQIARDERQPQRVLALTATLLAEPSPAPEVRYFHAEALFITAEGNDPAAVRGKLLEAETELTRTIDAVWSGHPILAPAYVIRSHVRRRLSRAKEAEADLEEAQRVNRNDPEVIEQAAQALAGAGDLDCALRILRAPAVDDVPELLAMRAEILLAKRQTVEARADVDAAIAALTPGSDADSVFVRLAETALLLGDRALVDSLRVKMTDEAKAGPMGRLLAGEIAFADGDIDRGTARYREAASLDPDKRVPLMMRLGLELLDARHPAEALAVFTEVWFDALSEHALQPYAMAAIQAGDLAAALAAVDRLAQAGPLPHWALAMSADIALRRDDPEMAAAHLTALENRGGVTARVRLALARCLVELGREQEAREQSLAALTAEPTPGERIQAAIYLKEFGQPEEALAQALQAFRDDRRDPQIQRAFATLLFTGGVDLPIPTAVAEDTYVRLRRHDGSLREHTIFAGPPIDPSNHEMSAADAATACLLGKRVGEVIERDAGHWSGQTWTVEEILPAAVHAARQIIETFADNFPREPFFVVGIHVGDGGQVADWTGLMAALGERQQRAIEVLRVYHEQTLPLEFVAAMLQAPVPELMLAASRDRAAGPLLVEWADASGQAASVATATAATTVILTRSALATAQRLGLLDHLVSHYEVVAPTSLIWQLRVEIAEAKKAVAAGRSTMVLAAYGPHIEDIPANDPRLREAVEAAVSSLEWVEQCARKEPRPYKTVREPGSPEEEVRDRVGPPSFDALALAETGIGALYADDLGLRRLTLGSRPRPASFSTVTLLEVLAAKGAVSSADRDRYLADLVLAGYAFVRPSSGLLHEGIRRMPGLGRDGLLTICGPLGGPLVTALEAATLAARAIKLTAMAQIQTTGVDTVTEAAVRAMATRWRQPVAARLVQQQAERELALLPPRYLETVVRTCTTLAAEGIPTI